MRALFHSPYFDSLGGGERYILTLISLFQQRGHQTDLVWHEQEQLRSQAKKKFALNLAPLNLEPSVLTLNPLQRYLKLRQYDLVFSVSDGSLPLLAGSPHSIIHFQVPFHSVNGNSPANRFKNKFIHQYICNSHFTQDFIDDEYQVASQVIYPPVDVDEFSHSIRKSNSIVYVGRFSDLLQSKGHLQLIEAFKKLYNSGITNYRLYLAGSTEVGSNSLIKSLKQSARGYPIEIILDPPFSDIKELYEQARFFWSLAGVDVNEIQEPERCEHFGITLVEAMAAGCIPLVIRKGGFREILTRQSGILCDSTDELIFQTRKIINNSKQQDLISAAAHRRAQYFSVEKFISRFQKIIPNF